ncbi:HECT-domain (ubiquitin-transferase) domain-containing protein [Cardiosporidium cionae]|uniref:HECT-type E3 ubiquitin transferase n=1 Tax=Cardiosporidium cionae TaxID=476202 RepID=A0ABQ7JD58_9APIC|nr:HECT-domain (ubiquitin-transferase) domain-containing protein [Cardiosporidium cionae]|eukprot:KAF8821804.1 HECT-domain (ubiquitin-transferase) domain-containing protein [Cardiosporidium cionae]
MLGRCFDISRILARRRKHERTNLTNAPNPNHRQHVEACPVCNKVFATRTNAIQAERHVEACLLINDILDPKVALHSNETLIEWWNHCFGTAIEEIITFVQNPRLSDSVTVTAREEADIAGSLLCFIRQNNEESYGESEEVSRQRYFDYALTLPRTFSCIIFSSLEEKKQWFHAQLNSLRVNFSTCWIDIHISREALLFSSYTSVRFLSGHDFHKEFKIRFAGESAQDAGGLTREWFTLCAAEIFNPKFGLFLYSDVDNLTYQINPYSSVNERHLEYFYFVGQFIGKAIFDKQVILAPLARPVLKKLLQRPVEMEDLAFIDLELYNSLCWILENRIKDILFETFTVESDCYGKKLVIELKPNGINCEVTDETKEEYVKLRTEHKVVLSIQEQLDALCSGLWNIIPISLLRVFDFQELDLLINGLPQIDVEDWIEHTVYEGDYDMHHFVVQWFWSSIRRFSDEERARLLQFATGSSRLPAEGFIALESNRGQHSLFTLRSTEWSEACPFPKAHTCFNRLDLPKYRTYNELRKYLLLAIQLDVTGFGLDD